MKTYRGLSIRGAAGGAALRTTQYRGVEHLVVPVVALVEGVVHAVNAEKPELVLAEELSRTVQTWNGSPAMYNHPDISGVKVSANSPEILEAFQLGQIFHTAMDGKRMLMEAYLNPSLVDAVGEGAQRLLETLRGGGMTEVSVGAFLEVEATEGNYNGIPYFGVWRNIVPDHLALLPEGLTGACSNEAGCGAGLARVAAAAKRYHILTAQGIEVENMPAVIPGAPPVKALSLRERLLESMRSVFKNAADGSAEVSDMELRRAVEAKLRDSVPAFAYLGPLYPEKSEAIFETYTSDGQWHLWKQTYSVADDGTVSLDGEAVEVQLEQSYVEIKAAEEAAVIAPTEVVAACGCKNSKQPQPETLNEEGVQTMSVHRNASRITALIANPKTPWGELDRAHLEAQEDARLATLEQQAADAAKEPEPAPAPEIKLTDLPQAWQDAINGQAVAAAAAKSAKVIALAGAQTVFSKDQLEAKSVEELTQIEQLMGLQAAPPAPSFAGLSAAAPVQRTAADTTAPPKPSFATQNDAIRAAAGRK